MTYALSYDRMPCIGKRERRCLYRSAFLEDSVKTASIMVQNLCVPCSCRCRYCLLCWDGKAVGVDWARGAAFAQRIRAWQKENMPEAGFSFSFGYAMEPEDPVQALRFLRKIGSPQAEFWQCDGMHMRSEAECEALAALLAREGVKHLSFTVYGQAAYHDRFAGRAGDHALLMRMLRAACAADLQVSVRLPLTKESAPQADRVIGEALEKAPGAKVSLFIPHSEGRGAALEGIRFSGTDQSSLSPEAFSRLNHEIYRPEGEWLLPGAFKAETQRMLLISLRRDNAERLEKEDAGSLIQWLEDLDERYYAAFPALPELAARYGDSSGARYFSQRDLFAYYRRLYARETGLKVYDVTDERQCGSRRY